MIRITALMAIMAMTVAIVVMLCEWVMGWPALALMVVAPPFWALCCGWLRL